MKTLVFVQVAAQMSGVEFSTLYLARHLDREIWDPVVVCPAEGELPEQCRAAGVRVAIVPQARFFSTSVRFVGVAVLNPFAVAADFVGIWRSARRLSRFLAEQSAALVVTKGLLAHFYGGLAARWNRVPCVWHVQDQVSGRAGPFFPWVLSLLGRLLARELIADAESIARQLGTFVPPQNISVIWNGVDTNEFSPQVDGAAVRREWAADPGDVLIGVIGRLTPWKGQHILLQAYEKIAAEFPHARLVIVGSALFDTDQYARSLQSQVEAHELSGRVRFAGFRRELPQVLAALDVVAHTALEKDSTPLAVVSAMASGKPIVCSRVDGTAELFEDGTDGLLVPPGDSEALADRLGSLLRDGALRARLGRAARAKAERCLDIERFDRECALVFSRALS